MTSPLLVAAIAFWGWQTGHWAWAAGMALALGASFHVDARWDFPLKVQYRAADVSYLLAFAEGAFFFFTEGNPQGLVSFFAWLPVALLPLMLVHAYGTHGRMDQRVLFWRLRMKPPVPPRDADPWFGYFALWLVGASAANVRGPGFYIGLVAIGALALWRLRPRAPGIAAWVVAFALAAGLGYGVQASLYATHLYLTETVPQWLTGMGSLTDPFHASTRMGEGGVLDESDTIALRIVTDDGRPPPRLFHLASYDSYSDRDWLATRSPFTPLRGSEGRYRLAPAPAGAQRVTIHDHVAGRNPVLSLPPGAVVVTVPVDGNGVGRNRLGAVQAPRPAGLFAYTVGYTGAADDDATTAQDVAQPKLEREAFAALAARLQLATLPPAQRVERVRAFFRDGFAYTLDLSEVERGRSPVVEFVTRTKAGHCEYYATATVLLLRAAGIPARYATGYAVSERSALDGAYIARLRHRHAWARAYVDNVWIDVDTTPPSWLSPAAQDRGLWSRWQDTWAWLRVRWSEVAATRGAGAWATLGLAVALGLVLAWYAWRFVRYAWSSRRKRALDEAVAAARPGADSEFYAVENVLREAGLGRAPADTTRAWLARVAADPRFDAGALADIVALHERYRFDPVGLAPAQRAALREGVAAWMQRHAAAAHSRGRDP